MVVNKKGKPVPGGRHARTAHFDHDMNKNPITPVDVLMAGLWNLNIAGLRLGQKTVKTGSIGAQGTWATDCSSRRGRTAAPEIRSFAAYTDSVTGEEMAFAGTDAYGIFSGGFNSSTNAIQWGANGEGGTTYVKAPGVPGDELCRLWREALRFDL